MSANPCLAEVRSLCDRRVKIRMQRAGDVWVDRIPAWIKWATVEPGKMGATYDGVFWDPPNK